uniref:Beta-defensin-like domain-containing protein n=1 Tax=Chrysemys picta bellii TaxID=8478 RepID=A0A8C3HRW5_CHRPI
ISVQLVLFPFLLLFFCAGFTQDKPSIPKPTNVIECIRAGGICFGRCLSPFRPIGTCNFRVPCCKFSIPQENTLL